MDLVGAKLRELRLAKKLGVRELAARLDRAPAYVVQLEQGLLKPKRKLLESVFAALEVSEGEPAREQIFALTNVLEYFFDPQPRLRDVGITAQSAIAAYEKHTTTMQSLSTTFLKDLLHEPGYSHALLEASPKPVPVVNLKRALTGLSNRKRILKDAKPRQLEFIIAEHCFYPSFASPPIMAKQVRALADIHSQGHHFIGVLPLGSPIIDFAGSGFTILDGVIAWTDLLADSHVIADRQKVSDYVQFYGVVRSERNLIFGDELYARLIKLASRLDYYVEWPVPSVEIFAL